MKQLFVFTGGGTGGHVYPALAVIEEMKKEGIADFYWIGSSRGMEKNILAKTSIPYKGIPSGKLRRYFSLQNFIDLFKIAAGFFSSLLFLMKNRPVLLFSKGGFVTVPPVMAAWLLRIPVFTHESDLDPGLATKINSLFARKIFIPYEESRRFYSAKNARKLEVLGNPVRPGFKTGKPDQLRKKWGISPTQQVLFIMGGSSGARQINGLIREILPHLPKDKVFVVHQIGDKAESLEEIPGFYKPLAYIHEEMADLWAMTDLLVSRSGAGTLWEMALLEKPSILIPLESGSRGDQLRNARLFEEKGASILLSGERATGAELLKSVLTLIEDKEVRIEMGQNARSLVREDSAYQIGNIILKAAEQ